MGGGEKIPGPPSAAASTGRAYQGEGPPRVAQTRRIGSARPARPAWVFVLVGVAHVVLWALAVAVAP